MPIDSFEVLHQARGGVLPKWLARPLAQFRLFAIVLHDPELHSEFHQTLTDDFDYLHQATADRLLFFALVPAPSSWSRRRAAEPYIAAFEKLRDRIGYGPPATIASTQRVEGSALSEALALAVGVRPEDLPCLLILKDLRDADAMILTTNSRDLSRQLIALGKAAHDGRTPADLGLQSPAWPTGAHGAGRIARGSIAGHLADVLATTLPGKRSIDVAKKAIVAALGRLDEIRQDATGEDEYEDVERAALLLAHLIAFTSGRYPRASEEATPFVTGYEEHLERESRVWLGTALRCASMSDVVGPILGTEWHDETPGVICLGKLFEHEVNLSIGQEVRRRLGVPMGEFYDRPWPGAEKLGARGKMNQRSRHDPGRWQSPGLGAVREEAKAERPPPYCDDIDDIMFEHWKRIEDLRNAAAHPRAVTRRDFAAAQTALSELARHEFFVRVASMKRRLRSTGRS